MNCGKALDLLLTGKAAKLSREGWNNKGMWIELQMPDENSKMTRPYIFINVDKNTRVPFQLSQHDLCSSDWQVIE